MDDEIPVQGKTDDFVKIVPTASDYRDTENKKLVITDSYLEPFEKAIANGAKLSAAELAKVLPIDQIRSAGIFDRDLFEAFGGQVASSIREWAAGGWKRS